MRTLPAALLFVLTFAACGKEDPVPRPPPRDAQGATTSGPDEPINPPAADDEEAEVLADDQARAALAAARDGWSLHDCSEPVESPPLRAVVSVCHDAFGPVELHYSPRRGVGSFSGACRDRYYALLVGGDNLGRVRAPERWHEGLVAKECSFEGGSLFETVKGLALLRAPLPQAVARGVGVLGAPEGDDWAVGPCGERAARFAGGGVVGHPSYGGYALTPPLFERYLAWREARGETCDPVTTPEAVQEDNKGRMVKIASGYRIYSHPNAGAHVVPVTDEDERQGRQYKRKSSLGDTWFAEGGPGGRLGYPIGEVELVEKYGRIVGARQAFQGGVVAREDGRGAWVEAGATSCPGGTCK